ncbi:hypothetical protein [Geodermatophilus sp. FMUSA9-8]|uniref:hypothetical protein n=1 Tax=Geodermatophilus sp. FMUSA9-8 TaxID=3120155 RepID=UPI00300BBAFE
MRDRRGRWIPLAVLATITVTVVLVLRYVFGDEDPYEVAERYGGEEARAAAHQRMADTVAAVVGNEQPLADRATERCVIGRGVNDTGVFHDSEGSLSCIIGRDVVLTLSGSDAAARAAARQLLGDRCPPEPDVLGQWVCADGFVYEVFAVRDQAVDDELAEWLASSSDGRYESVDVGDLIEHAGEQAASHLLALRFHDTYLDVSLDCPRPGC